MAKQIREKIGDVYRVRTVKTVWDKFVEGLQVVGGIIVVVFIFVAIFT